MPKFYKGLPKLPCPRFPVISQAHLGKIWAQIWAGRRLGRYFAVCHIKGERRVPIWPLPSRRREKDFACFTKGIKTDIIYVTVIYINLYLCLRHMQ
jgi:hypothetical protein